MVSDQLQRIEIADQAKIAWTQFVSPSLDVLRADYMGKLAEYAERPMSPDNLKVVEKMALALRVTREVETQMRSLIVDGEVARADLDRAGTIARMPDEQKRYATY